MPLPPDSVGSTHFAEGAAAADWWRDAVVYQVYPRSFADSDGDGIGDLDGVREHVDHLVALGVDAVWLSPFYPSALADGGYDIDDHRDVAPELGDLAAFDAMVAALHAHQIKVIVDIVPNHTSDRHRWFQAALAAGPGSDERDRYVFRSGRGPGGDQPPSDWESDFGGPAWTRLPDGWWYLHLFAPEQPDLNWDRRDVRDDFLATLAFWADRGVDGFRVDVANLLVKDLTEPLPDLAALATVADGNHAYSDRDAVQEVYAEWRTLFDRYDPPRMAVAEAWVPAHRRARYARPESLGQAFNFDLLSAPWDAPTWRRVITENLDLSAESGSTSTWVLSNHDVIRHPTRYGITAAAGQPNAIGYIPGFGVDPDITVDEALGARRARAATLLMLALPGSAYLYQGEELGLFEVAEIDAGQRQDPTFFRTGGTRLGRDGCRVPLPWTSEPSSYGFSPDPASAPPHLPQPAWFADLSVARENGDDASSLTLYRRALRLRRELTSGEGLTWVPSEPGVLHVVRAGGWHCLTNFGPDPVPVPPGELLLASGPLVDGSVPTDTTVWVRGA
ncbi:alpha-amylase family glycosyl hydrolase [Microlunatus antarcticus]|uniref:Alpha-glucosidase n=1 Tax=Microlunatus antarcticus TaxID=53388 RepID=A0A7W5JW78_9ACTN|nr:alpha-amylase family glycosyl hydrolase [Microlunatus antarcticus]MBB3326897.1 alpha-glucosidase [Microlunatus antarcticus]